MRREPAAAALGCAGLAAWAALVGAPVALLAAGAAGGAAAASETGVSAGLVVRTAALAAAVAALAVVLGWVPGRLLGTARRGRAALFALLLAPLLLPQYLQLYAWRIYFSPPTALGGYLSMRPALAEAVGTAAAAGVLLLWHWPLAALLLSQGWRSIDRDVWEAAELDASRRGRLVRVALPLLAPSLLLAFGVVFVMGFGEYAVFHLAGVRTLGMELGVVYEQTGSARAVARAAWPTLLPAAAVALLLWRRTEDWSSGSSVAPPNPPHRAAWRWAVLAALLAMPTLLPAALLAAAMAGPARPAEMGALMGDKLAASLGTSAAAAGGALLLAGGALALGSLGRAGRMAAGAVQPTLLLAALLPGSLVGASLVEFQAALRRATGLPEGWWTLSAGLAARFAGVALIVLRLALHARSGALDELASTDGASLVRRIRSVHLPQVWPAVAGAALLVAMLSMTEVPATVVLLPPGLANFAQTLLNQMHFARDRLVVASCLMLMGTYAGIGALVALVAWVLRGRHRRLPAALFLACFLVLSGCHSRPTGVAKVVGAFGTTGWGPGEFVYPRAIDIAADGTLWVGDKTGRVQHLTGEGKPLGGWRMPDTDAGLPTGLTVGPDGNVYLADTHYHRVVAFTPAGRLARRWGGYGTGAGQFIYPTDVAFGPDGRIYISEYGGNDRVSIYSAAAEFLGAFGSFGGGRGQFARPSAVQIDPRRRRLYVADACNHRVTVHDLDGRLIGGFGAAGQAPGELRYPYDLALAGDGRLLVCEYGNNRVQLFRVADDGSAVSEGVWGGPGRQLGRLAYPWGVCLGAGRRAYVVDAGNNRVQVWQLE